MKLLLLFNVSIILFFKSFLFAYSADGIPLIPDRVIKNMEKLQNTDPVQVIDYSPAVGLIVSKRYKETMQLFQIKRPGDKLMQLTYGNEPVFNATINPDSTRHCLLFEKDTNGNEISQIYKLDLSDNSIQILTDGKSQNGNSVWSNRGDRFAFASTLKNGKDWGIYICPVDSPHVITPVWEKNGAWGIEDWSPDDSNLIISQYISSNESRFFVLNIKSKELKPLFGSDKEKMSLELGKWSKDGKRIFYTSDKETEQRMLYCYNLIDSTQISLSKDIPWSTFEFHLSHNNSSVAFKTNEQGFTKLYYMNLINHKSKQLNIPNGVLSRFYFSGDDSLLLFSLNKPTEADAVYSINVFSGKLVKWTSQKNPVVSDAFTPQIEYYPTFDSVNNQKRMIPCFTYMPEGKGPFPVVIMIHGGPESQYWPYYSPLFTYILKCLHCAILAPNVRGSNSYGKTWLSLDDGYNRENSVKDIGSLLDWIATQKNFDSSRVAVMGGSYGGYMSLASMVHYNNRLKAGIDMYGISNFITYLRMTRGSRVDLRRVEYGDERDTSMYKFLQKISPLTNVEKITKPMLIIQGSNDARVPVNESEQIVSALKKIKVPVWYLLFNDEGHGFNKKNNRDYETDVVAYFLEKYLLK